MTSIRIDPFRAADIASIEENPETAPLRLSDEQWKLLEEDPWTMTCRSLDTGRVLFCGGVTRHHALRGEAWGVFSPAAARHAKDIVRACRDLLDLALCTLNRVEAAVQCGHRKARRLCEVLGFEREAECMRKWHIDGRDYALYAKVREF